MTKIQKPRVRPLPKRRRPGVRATAKEKAEILDLIYRDSVSGLSVIEIVSKYGISRASFYRWQRQRDENERAINKAATTEHLDINFSIQILSGDYKANPAVIREALFQFITWIRWPEEQGYHLAAMINCISAYLNKKFNNISIQKIERVEAGVLFKYLTLEASQRFSSPMAAFNPDFEIVSTRGGRYDDRQFFAQLINYLLCESSNNPAPHHPTLSKLKILVEAGVIKSDWAMSPRTFEKYWRARAASFPFLYVEHYHSAFDWSLNPGDANFVASVDELIEGLGGLREYFGKVKWVIQELRRVLNPRAVTRISFPMIPDVVKAIAVKNPSFSYQIEAKIVELIS